jgi:hypothetical protein
MEKKTQNLMDGLFDEMNRVREIITEYKSIPKNAGMMAASLMELSIKKAEKSIKDNDVIEMIRAYEDLKNYER